MSSQKQIVDRCKNADLEQKMYENKQNQKTGGCCSQTTSAN